MSVCEGCLLANAAAEAALGGSVFSHGHEVALPIVLLSSHCRQPHHVREAVQQQTPRTTAISPCSGTPRLVVARCHMQSGTAASCMSYLRHLATNNQSHTKDGRSMTSCKRPWQTLPCTMLGKLLLNMSLRFCTNLSG